MITSETGSDGRIHHPESSRKHTGNLYSDEEVLAAEGVIDLARYAVVRGTKNLLPELFVD